MSTRCRPTVSVILPVLNAASTLGESLRSIANQSFRDFEVIAIDDGSSDDSVRILREFADTDQRLIVVSRPNKGLVATLNEGIQLARGPWLARMDADDIALPDRFAVQLAQLQVQGADFCGGWVECFGQRSGCWRYPVSHEACKAHALFDVPFAHPTVIGRTDAFLSLGYDAFYERAEDYDLWHRALLAGYRFTNVPAVVLRYRVSSKQTSTLYADEQSRQAAGVRERLWSAVINPGSPSSLALISAAVNRSEGSTQEILPLMQRLYREFVDTEAREVFLTGCFRIFCKMACSNRLAFAHWLTLVTFRRGLMEAPRSLVILVLSLLRAGPKNRFYHVMKRLYVR